jgi:hypothetical protein
MGLASHGDGLQCLGAAKAALTPPVPGSARPRHRFTWDEARNMKSNSCALIAFAALLGAVSCLRAQEPPTPTIATYAGLTFTEANSATWTIEATSDLSLAGGWSVVADTVSVQGGEPTLWLDLSSKDAGRRFYRVVASTELDLPAPTIATYTGLTFTEANSASWTIEATSDFSLAGGWSVVEEKVFVQGGTPTLWLDPSSLQDAGRRFYRVVAPAASDGSDYGTVTVKCIGLQALLENGPNFVLRLQYNRVLTTAETEAVVTALQTQDGVGSPSLQFNENISSIGYDGAGFDINATYIKFTYSGNKDTISINLPSDIVFLEWQIFFPLNSNFQPTGGAQPTFSGENYFVFQDTNGQDIEEYPLEPGNPSLKSYGFLKSQKAANNTTQAYELAPAFFTQSASVYKIDDASSSENFLSGSKDLDGCNISYVLGGTATSANPANLSNNAIPAGSILDPYTLIQVKVDKSLIDGVFDPYLDEVVPSDSPANYISMGFHTVGQFSLPLGIQTIKKNTWNYGVSAHDIKQLGSDDDFYYLYFTTSQDVYEAAMVASGYQVDERPVYPPIVSPDGERRKGYLLYNGNTSDLQGAMLMRIRNGNYTNADLAEFFAAPCYDTVDVNQPFINGWIELRGN